MGKKGLVEVYSGNGKGKTSASIGIAIRAKAHNLKVCYIYFHKDPEKYGNGEIKILKEIGIDVFGFAKKHPFCNKNVKLEKIRNECLKGLEFLKNIYEKNIYDVIILDEILISLRDGFLKEEEIMEIIEKKPEKVELILTGRGVTEKIIEKADLVSEIRNIKHPYDRGIKAREGFEY